MKNYSIKNRILSAALCLCIALSSFSFLAYLAPKVFGVAAAETTFSDFNTAVNLSNGQFTGSTSVAPASPSAWTGEYIGRNAVDDNTGEFLGNLGGNVVSGVISLDANFTKNYDDLKLDIYPEFKKTAVPGTPFGAKSENPIGGFNYPNTNKNVLMINTDGSRTAYGYSSESITLAANSYYKISAWVKTGIFGDQQGAAFTLVGLAEPVGIWNIDTVNGLPKDGDRLPILTTHNNYGFVEQILYIAVGPNTESAQIRLSVGDNADSDHYFLSKGYAFFANVTAYQMSPTNFHFETVGLNNRQNVLVYDMNPTSLLKVKDKNGNLIEAGSFSGGKNGWSRIDDDDNIDPLYWNTYNGAGAFAEGLDAFGFLADPRTPNGEFDILRNNERGDNNIMVLSSFEGNEKYRAVSAGIRSGGILVEKEKYYRLSMWYNTQNGASATVTVSGHDTSYLGKLGDYQNGSLSTDNNAGRYGWQRTTFYIKGSAFSDVEINVELWLGGEGGYSSGIVMFDDITFEEITYRQHTDNKFGGTRISIDSFGSAGTGVSNGDFSEMDFGEENIFPLAPTGWTFIDTKEAGTTGHSNNLVKTDDIIHGVAPTEEIHYAANRFENYAGIENPRPSSDLFGRVNVLLMHSPVSAAFGYRSGGISISAETDYKLTVSLRTSLQGFGAALILKNGNSIVANIEGIHSSYFKDYSFYISNVGGSATLSLEIWLGLTDRVDNTSKLSAGHMFVNTVSLETLQPAEGETATVLAERMEEYNRAAHPSDLPFAVYKLGAYDFYAFDRYSADPIKPMYDMSLSQGPYTINRAGLITDKGENIVPDYFYDAHMRVDPRFTNVLYLENVNPGWSRYQADNTLALYADSYYKIDFSIMVEIQPDPNKNAIGAGIWLGEKGIEDIRNTYRFPVLQTPDGPQYEAAFKTFSFYYAVGSMNDSVSWTVSLGGKDMPNQAIAGRVFLNHILVTAIDSATFDSETARLEEEAEDAGEGTFFPWLKIDKRNPIDEEYPDEETTDKDEGCDTVAWYVIPSILFAAAIFVALGAVVVKKFMAKHPKSKGGEKTAAYDRKEAHIRAAKDKEETEVMRSSDSVYDKFDEADDVVYTKKVKREKSVEGDAVVYAEKFAETPETAEKFLETEETPSFENEFDD
ncbi:MAG: hypothetical protein FWE84_01065 [Firmicutes bacterium]|nr:hypothetical protein [Bacillota bacterium]